MRPCASYWQCSRGVVRMRCACSVQRGVEKNVKNVVNLLIPIVVAARGCQQQQATLNLMQRRVDTVYTRP